MIKYVVTTDFEVSQLRGVELSNLDVLRVVQRAVTKQSKDKSYHLSGEEFEYCRIGLTCDIDEYAKSCVTLSRIALNNELARRGIKVSPKALEAIVEPWRI